LVNDGEHYSDSLVVSRATIVKDEDEPSLENVGQSSKGLMADCFQK
jgi:hypothetical protein